MNEPDEDFAALFEASLQTKRFEKGQTIEGTIVAIGPEVAFVNVGGKGEAMIEIDELKNADGALEVARRRPHPGGGGVDRGRADALAEAGARSRDRAAARRRVSRRASRGRQGRARGEGRIRGPHRPPARLLPDLADRHRAGTRTRRSTRGASTHSGSSSTRKAAGTSSSRAGRCSRRSSRRAPPRSGDRSSSAR